MHEEHVDVALVVQTAEADEDAALLETDRLLPRKLFGNLRQAPFVSGRPGVELLGGVVPGVDRMDCVAEQLRCRIEVFAGQEADLRFSNVVAIVDEVVPQPTLSARREVSLVLFDELADVHFAGDPPLDRVLEARDIVTVILQVLFRHDEADALYLLKVAGIEAVFPIEGNVASLDDEVLPVLDGRLYDLPDDSPQVRGEQVVVLGRKLCLAAADEPHLQKVDREHGIAVPLHEPLRQEGLARMARSAYENHHLGTVLNLKRVLLWSKPGAVLPGRMAVMFAVSDRNLPYRLRIRDRLIGLSRTLPARVAQEANRPDGVRPRDRGSIGIRQAVGPPSLRHGRAALYLGQRLSVAGCTDAAAPLLDSGLKRRSQVGRLQAPVQLAEHVDVVEVPHPRVEGPPREGGLDLLREHGLHRVGPYADVAVLEHEAVPVHDLGRGDRVPRRYVDLQGDAGLLHAGRERNPHAAVLGVLHDLSRAADLELNAVVELDGGDLLHDLEGVARIERQSLDGRVDVHRAALVHAHERGHQHAALEHEVVPVWGVREPFQEPLHGVVAQERLGPAAVSLRLVADQVLHPARALYHRSTSIACCTCLSTPISLA